MPFRKGPGPGIAAAVALAAGAVLCGAVWAGLRCVQLLYGA